MSESLQIALVTAVVTAMANGLVTWGVIATKLAWARRDIDVLFERVSRLERRE
jgi:hypothetical protein